LAFRQLWIVATLSAMLSTAARAGATIPLPLKAIADIPLPGSTSRFDYESYDAGRHLLFIAHLGDSEVLVFDTKKQSVVAQIKDISHVHGVAVIPELGRVYASATRTDEVVAIDEDRLVISARMPGGVYPDGIAYAPDAHKLYVSDETGETETVIDVRSSTRVATVPLGGEVGNTQYDPVLKHIFVNVQSRRQLIEIDPATDQVMSRIDLAGAKGNHGLLIESKLRLALIACEDNDKLVVLDLQTRQIKATFSIGGDPDVLAYDPTASVLFVAGESGNVSAFRMDAAGVTKIGEGFVGPNAHVVSVDSETHSVYFPIKNLNGKPVLRVMQLAGAPVSH